MSMFCSKYQSINVIELYEDGWVLTDKQKDAVLDGFAKLREINARLAPAY